MNIEKGTIVAIIRGVEPSDVIDIQEALLEGGINWVEVSLSNEDTGIECIRRLNEHFGDYINLGVGTVTNMVQAQRAVDAGAKYIITPGWDRELVRNLKGLKVEILPGVFTPGEVMQALNEGVKVFKLFPASNLGISYIKNLKGPFPNIHVMAVGGISLDNIQDYFEAGFSSFGIGSDLVPRGATKKDFETIKNKALDYTNAMKK